MFKQQLTSTPPPKRLCHIHMLHMFQVASYGGNLMFTLQFSAAQDTGEQFRDVDIELIVSDAQIICNLNFFHLQHRYAYSKQIKFCFCPRDSGPMVLHIAYR